MEKKSEANSPASSSHSRSASTLSEKSERTRNSFANTSEEPIDPIDKVDESNFADEKETKEVSPLDDVKPVSVLKLFRFADKLDIILNITGTFFSCASGVITPVMIIIFSELMNVILKYYDYLEKGDLEGGNHYLDHESRHYCLLFLILGIVMWVVSFGVNACWAIAAENQGLRIRKLYYESIMRQDIGWFDTVKTGELTTRITNDVNLVQEGLGEKFGFVFMNVVAFITAFIIAFVKGWKLTFICLCVIPFIAAAGGYLGLTISKLVTFAQDKTAASGAIADEVISGI
ncbi:Multidrug resistance protein 1, partial [Coemansia sp. RSA 1250]